MDVSAERNQSDVVIEEFPFFFLFFFFFFGRRGGVLPRLSLVQKRCSGFRSPPGGEMRSLPAELALTFGLLIEVSAAWCCENDRRDYDGLFLLCVCL